MYDYRRLYEASNSVIRFIKVASPKVDTGTTTVDDQIEKVKLEQQMNLCMDRMERFIARQRESGSLVDESGANLLRVHYRTLKVWLSVVFDAEESANDQHREDFKEIVRLSELILSGPDKHKTSDHSEFAFEMGTL